MILTPALGYGRLPSPGASGRAGRERRRGVPASADAGVSVYAQLHRLRVLDDHRLGQTVGMAHAVASDVHDTSARRERYTMAPVTADSGLGHQGFPIGAEDGDGTTAIDLRRHRWGLPRGILPFGLPAPTDTLCCLPPPSPPVVRVPVNRSTAVAFSPGTRTMRAECWALAFRLQVRECLRPASRDRSTEVTFENP